jgi:hypothetical protein
MVVETFPFYSFALVYAGDHTQNEVEEYSSGKRAEEEERDTENGGQELQYAEVDQHNKEEKDDEEEYKSQWRWLMKMSIL